MKTIRCYDRGLQNWRDFWARLTPKLNFKKTFAIDPEEGTQGEIKPMLRGNI